MKRFGSCIFVLFLSITAVNAQQLSGQVPSLQPPISNSISSNIIQSPQAAQFQTFQNPAANTLIWSEDFANGIPSSWTNQGYVIDFNTGALIPNAAADWEYRGTNTTPSNAVGSRGAYSGTSQSGNQGPPIQSASAGNGFVIFDSDYLDTGGDRTNMGGGIAPAPHIGTLTTSPINLTGHPLVELSFSSYAREFHANFGVAISTNGGSTFPDTVFFHSDLAVNASSANGDRVKANISPYVGNQSNVVLSFIFDGRPGNTLGHGFYYWMIDDIEVADLPSNSLEFVEWQDSPAQDIIFAGGSSPKYGHINIEQAVPISFNANIFNYAANTQYNVNLHVTVVNSAGATVATLNSPSFSQLLSGDTGTFANFTTTGTWTPSDTGVFGIFYQALSDSINTAEAPASLGYTLEVTDESYLDGLYSYSFGNIDNYIGTGSLASGSIVAIGEAFTFPNSSPDSAGYVLIDGISVPFSPSNDPNGGIFFWQVFDTTGFAYGSVGPAGNSLFDTILTVSNIVGGTHFFDFRQISGSDTLPLVLPANKGYHFIMSMIPNGSGEISIGNDQTITNQPPKSVMMQTDAGSWYSGFSNSDNLSSPIFLMQLSPSAGNPNGVPSISLSATPVTGNIPLAVNFDASATTDPDGDPLSFTWDFGDGNSGTGATVSHTYTAAGIYSAQLTVSDGNTTLTDNVQITAIDPSNVPPVASFTATPDSGLVALSVSFDASATTDANNDPLTYTWDFSDSTAAPATGQTATHVYNSIGTYWAVLTVNDGKLGVDQDSVEIQVVAVPNSLPTAVAVANPDSGLVPLAVSFNANGSSDPDNDPLTYTWNFGNGSTGTGKNTFHMYNAVGTYWVTLSVADGNGGMDYDSVKVVVSPIPNSVPTAVIVASIDSGYPPLSVSFDGSNSNDPDSDPMTFTWDFGDGSAPATGVTSSNVYTTPGTYCATLTVDDGNGGTDTAMYCIEALTPNNPPMVSFTATPDSGGTPLTVTFDATATTDADGDSLSYIWDFGDGSTGTDIMESNIYSLGSTQTDTIFLALLTVHDGHGNTVTDSMAIYLQRGFGIVGYTQGHFLIYPNPNDGKFNLGIAESGNYNLEIIDMAGRKLFSKQLSGNAGEKLQIDVSHLPTATYIINLHGEKGVMTEKLTIR